MCVLTKDDTTEMGVYNTLTFRAKVVCTSQQALQTKMDHINKALEACNLPAWASTVYVANSTANTTATMDIQTFEQPNKWTTTTVIPTKNISIVVPYTHVLAERF